MMALEVVLSVLVARTVVVHWAATRLMRLLEKQLRMAGYRRSARKLTTI